MCTDLFERNKMNLILKRNFWIEHEQLDVSTFISRVHKFN